MNDLDLNIRLPPGLEHKLNELMNQASDVLTVCWYVAAALLAFLLLLLYRRLTSQ